MSEEPKSRRKEPVQAPPFWRGRGMASSAGSIMRWVFSTSALFTIIALGLIIFFLLKESAGFFKQYHSSLITYRQSGMEFTQIMKSHHREYVEIAHELSAIRSDWIRKLNQRGLTDEAKQSLLRKDEINRLLRGYRIQLEPLREHLDERIQNAIHYREHLGSKESVTSAPAVELSQIVGELETYTRILSQLNESTDALFKDTADFDFEEASLNRRLRKASEANLALHEARGDHLQELRRWKATEPVDQTTAILSFFLGSKWTTASDQQNRFGLLPLLTGSLLVSAIALLIAAPVGIGAAIYVNQIATVREQKMIKPFIELMSALPTVIIGFFGVMVFGEFVRGFSQIGALQWLPFFPIQERFNAFTAGALLGFMAIPTIFALTEDALNHVPNQLKDASYAIGGTKLQTLWRTIIPYALPGIVSATMLGFGRVIGETMVVLLCAGNRVKIPEFAEGIQTLFEPVHTMTGMIAQEMGEVVYGSMHYRALFMVGVVLFFASLIINYTARTLARRSLQQERS